MTGANFGLGWKRRSNLKDVEEPHFKRIVALRVDAAAV
jgi:hypothetical protein